MRSSAQPADVPVARQAGASAASFAAFAVVLLVAFLLWTGLFALREAEAHEEFDVAQLVRWELGALANKWLFAAGAPLRDDPQPDEALAAWFALGDRRDAEGRRLENVAEAAIEGRVDAAVREQGLSFPLPLPGALKVWPPLDIELTASPHVLVISPRTEIRRQEQRVLQFDLGRDELLEIEREAEERGRLDRRLRGADGRRGVLPRDRQRCEQLPRRGRHGGARVGAPLPHLLPARARLLHGRRRADDQRDRRQPRRPGVARRRDRALRRPDAASRGRSRARPGAGHRPRHRAARAAPGGGRAARGRARSRRPSGGWRRCV